MVSLINSGLLEAEVNQLCLPVYWNPARLSVFEESQVETRKLRFLLDKFMLALIAYSVLSATADFGAKPKRALVNAKPTDRFLVVWRELWSKRLVLVYVLAFVYSVFLLIYHYLVWEAIVVLNWLVWRLVQLKIRFIAKI